MSRKADLVIFGLPRWDGPFSSTALSLAIELSKEVRVFYIENPYTIKDYVTQFWKIELRKRMMALFFGINKYQEIEDNSNLINVTPHLTLPINFLAKGKIYNYLSAINNFLVERSLASIKKDFAISSFLFINSYNPFYFSNIRRQNPICSIYHCVDNIAESKYIGKHGSSLERSMIKDYDLTITTSRRLLDYALELSSHSYLLPNAADFKLFYNAKKRLTGRPKEMQRAKGKIIGYIGSVDHRIDYTLLESVARNYPDWTLLLVGPLSNEYKASQLGEYSNVVAVGSKPLNELPLFVKFCSRVTHYLQYVFMLLMPISGVLMSILSGKEIPVFGIFTVPALEKNTQLAGIFYQIHVIAIWFFIALIIFHISAALYHHFIRKDQVLTRMIK